MSSGIALITISENGIQNPESRIQNPESRIQNPESRIQNPESRIQNGTLMSDTNFRLLLVSAALLMNKEGKVLLAQRPPGKSMAGLWEFPGGKIQSGETPEQALVRELKEELAIEVNLSDLRSLSFASHCYENFHLLMPLYLCRHWKGLVQPKEGQKFVWITLDEFDNFPMPPADKPLIPNLQKLLS